MWLFGAVACGVDSDAPRHVPGTTDTTLPLTAADDAGPEQVSPTGDGPPVQAASGAAAPPPVVEEAPEAHPSEHMEDEDAGVITEPEPVHLRCPTDVTPDPRDQQLSSDPTLIWVGFSIDVLVPQAIIDWMDERELEEAHFAWHLVRRWDELCGASFATGEGCDFAQSLQSQSLMRATAQQGAPGAGSAFLAMHRHMIQMLEAAFPGHRGLFSSFTHVPLSQSDGQNPMPWRNIVWTPDNLLGFDLLEHIEDHLDQFPDEDALGLYIESNVIWTPANPFVASGLPGAGVHAALHNQWAVQDSPANLGRLDLALRNFVFWKLHGFIDDVWQRYRVAKGLRDDDPAYVQLLDDECYGMHQLQPSHRMDESHDSDELAHH